MSRAIELAVDAGIATLTFNRPEVMNAMDGDMMTELRAAAELAERDAGVRVVVLRGAGPAFIAGGDVAVFAQRLPELPELIVRWGRDLHFAIQALRRMGKPVLASVHGATAGAGFSILCAADLAIAADTARFSLAYANIGASPDGGSTWFLPRLLGYKKAMELILLPDLFDAKTALQHGLVNWVVPEAQLAGETQRIAQRLAQGPTYAYGEAKRLLNASIGGSMQTQMEEELFAFSRCARTHDLAEGMTAFVEKRKAQFRGT
jgi:2-(1,2-epoxy-1,2-dihydrophenyl)acetyl-CoA isomerase